jgi:hypothetical protein
MPVFSAATTITSVGVLVHLLAALPAWGAPLPVTRLARASLPDAAPPHLATSPLPEVRGRATTWGALVGTIVGLAAAVPLALAFCADAEEGNDDFCGGNFLLIGGFVGVLGGAAGAVSGSLVGAGVPQHRPVGARLGFYERASGEIGQLSLQLGTSTVLGARRSDVAAVAARASFLTKFGRWFALGPELAFYPLSRRHLHVEGLVTEHNTQFLGGVLRAGAPVGALYPYFTGALGYYHHLFGNVGGSAGLGAEWRLAGALSAGGEARVHTNLDALGEPFMNVTAGASWHW